MKKNIIFTVLALLYTSISAFAHIDVVYPTKQESVINSASVFFIGNTTKNAKFTINSENVKLWDDNFFVHVVPLNYGKNTIKLKPYSTIIFFPHS